MKLFKGCLGPLKEFDIETVAKETLIDEHSKKLKEHLKLMLYSIYN